MFKFKELGKLFKYNYKNFFINMMPKYNKRVILKNTFYNLLSGIILLFIGYVLSMIVFIKVGPLVENMEVNYLGIGNNMGHILLILFPMGILIYTLIIRDKEITGKVYYIILLISLVLIIILLFRIITFIGILTLNGLLGILGLLSIGICLFGYGFILVGIIDHLILLKRDYLSLTTTFKKVEIKTSTIDVDDVSMH